jgi:lysophospholipase L1-like esterase
MYSKLIFVKLFSLSSIIILLTAFIIQKKTKIIFFGDSITQAAVQPFGYIMKMDSLCKREGKSENFEFVGAGISGHKVYDLVFRLDNDVLAKNPDVVVIYIGINDIWHKTLTGTGTDPERFEKFYQVIIDKLKAGSIKTVLCTPSVIGEKTDFSNPQDGDLNEYSKIVRRLALKNNVPLVDLRKAFLDYIAKNNPENKDRGILTTDRVHLNEKGNQLVAEEMWKVIQSL